MTRRTTAARRLSALSISLLIVVAAVGCGNDDEGSSQPSTPPTTAAPGESAAPGGSAAPTAPADPLEPFADIDEATMNSYCDAVQAAIPFNLDNVEKIADIAPPAIAEEYEPIVAYAADRQNAALQESAAISIYRLYRLHEDVCGIPVKFG